MYVVCLGSQQMSISYRVLPCITEWFHKLNLKQHARKKNSNIFLQDLQCIKCKIVLKIIHKNISRFIAFKYFNNKFTNFIVYFVNDILESQL